MAGIIVEYARFVEVQQRRARVVAQLMQRRCETFSEIVESSAIDDQPVDIGESRQQLRSIPGEAARHPDSNEARIP